MMGNMMFYYWSEIKCARIKTRVDVRMNCGMYCGICVGIWAL